MSPRTASAFTLFEIAISLAILASTILVIAMVFPVGLRSQHLARSQIYACVTALNILETWNEGDQSNNGLQTEAQRLGQETFNRGIAPDLDRVLSMRAYELVPLPPAIAARLDSDDDEIGRLLADGAELYYPRMGSNQTGDFVAAKAATADADVRRLVFGIVGYAQQNALLNHPCLAWPYYDWYPMAPEPWEHDSWALNRATWPGYGEFDALYRYYNSARFATTDPPPPFAATYLRYASDLIAATGMPTTTFTAPGMPVPSPVPVPPGPLPPPPWSASDRQVFPPPAWVWAAAHLAHAAAVATDPSATPAASDDQRAYARACHEACLAWAMRYASTSPYDWGAPRPLNRQTAWDFPLLEWDLFPSAAFPSYAIPDGTGDVSWRVLGRASASDFGQARGNYGHSALIPPNHADIAGSWGDATHFNLLRPFSAAERTRQLVCWSAEWQAFDDFEEVPAATVDSGRCFEDSRGVEVTTEANWGKEHGERPFFWTDATRSRRWAQSTWNYQDWDYHAAVETAAYKAAWMGQFGADRDVDGKLSHGPLPRTARLRAVTVARFNLYDRRECAGFRF